jgi:2-oxoisovalerate dehydrogenase E1 component
MDARSGVGTGAEVVVPKDAADLLRRMVRIRYFEEALLERFKHGELRGTTHTSIGQEAIAVAALEQLHECDIVFSNHRCHGHFLAYGGDMVELLLEIKGNSMGVCCGLGGSQHLHFRNFYSNGLQGGIAPALVGMLLSERSRGRHTIGVCFLGDGTLGAGVLYESFNLASLWNLPIVFIVEDNHVAQSTPQALNLAGSISQRTRAFGIETLETDGNDVLKLRALLKETFALVRDEVRPFCIVCDTTRLGPHSKGDDTRSPEEMTILRRRDPIERLRREINDDEVELALVEARREVADALSRADDFANHQNGPVLLPCDEDERTQAPAVDGFYSGGAILGVEHLREAIVQHMELPESFLIGEDLLDPYGGAFKVSKGISTRFPGQVLTTPISESAIVGVAGGAALRGSKPLVEIMFGDFLTLAMDQIVNYISKYSRMFGRELECPIILRTPMGGYRGYGPTHSQSIEKMFIGVPGLTVVAFSQVHDQRLIFERMRALRAPVLYVENKLLYGSRMLPISGGRSGPFNALSSRGFFPTIVLSLSSIDGGANWAILTYGGMLPIALDAARQVFERYEMAVDVVVFSEISPLPAAELEFVSSRASRFVTLEEGNLRSGWGAEIIARLVEMRGHEKIVVRRCASKNTIIPNSAEGESAVLPSTNKLLRILTEGMSNA